MPKMKFQFTANWEREEEENYLKHIKAQIRVARDNAHLTQGELAKKLGRTQAYFSKLESGDLVVSIIELLGIARYTNTPIQFFLPIQDTGEAVLTGKAWQLNSYFSKITSEEAQDAVLSVAKHFAEVAKPKETE